jgi:two-component system CheB/CheR fusion protein
LVDEAGRILHTFSGAAEFLSPRDGRPSLNLTDLLQGELRFVVAGALKKAQKERHQVAYAGIGAATTREQRRVRVVVDFLPGSERFSDSYAVTFEVDRPGPSEPASETSPPAHERHVVGELLEERLSSVEGELRLTKENLQATVEEMETSNEELQATNEELIASNEELQSTNEELHSVNEELYTVNAEYQAKINELTELHADMNHLLEATEVHTIFLDRNLRLRKFTPKIAETFNLLPQDLGRRLDVFAHGFEDPAFIADIERVAAEGVPIEREIADRHGKAFLLRVLPYNSQSSLAGVVVTLIDISAIKRAQRALLTSEERYRTLVRSVTAILWTADGDGRICSPQSEWEAYTGHPFDVHKDDGWLAAVHPDDRAAIGAAWSRAVAEQRPFEASGRLFSQAHGDYRYFVARAAPIMQGPPGKECVREWVGHIIDAHESHLTQMQVQRQDLQLRSILDNSPAFIWLKDAGGRYLVAGKQCEAVLGVPCAEVVGKTDHDFLPAASADALRASERRVFEAGETVESEEMVPVGGELRTFLTVKFPLREERGRVYAVAGISTDITERKRQAEEIKGAVERRDQFLAMLSHELRTPLGAILNAADLVDRKDRNGAGNGHVKDGAAQVHRDGNGHAAFARDVIKRQTRHMAKLLEDLLDVGRITRDQLLLEPHPVDLRTVIEEAAEVVKPEVDRRQLELRIELPAHELPVWGDNVRLRQVFTNLLANAVAYTPAGHIEVDARVQQADGSPGQIVVTVADTGVGMSAADRERVFELFYQSPQTLERKRGGLGVGLTLALKLVKLHRGELTADSPGPNRGSVFTVTLPLSERTTASEKAAAPSLRQKQSKLRIVVVEDNQDIRDTLEDLLRLDGHEVISAKEGIGGAERIVEACPDVAIVDVGLPGMDGYAVAKAVRAARGKAVHLIALTGYGRREDRIEAAQAGFDRHLVKPVDHELLTQALADLLARPEA